MSAPHIDEDLLDQYATGQLRAEMIEGVEEHLLLCQHCQDRLMAADEFIGLFRAAATQPDARPLPWWRRLFHVRILAWSTAAALAAAVVSLIAVEFWKPPVAPATVLMQAFRGPEAATVIAARKPVRLVFDLPPTGAARDYEIRVVNLLGTQVLALPVEINEGHLSILIQKLEFGSYWVRLYRRTNRELIAEYGVRAE